MIQDNIKIEYKQPGKKRGLILNVLFIFVAFMLTMEDVEWQVRVGLKRVMFESSGFYLLTIVYLFNKIKK